MKATLEFDLPDERDEFRNAVHACDWRAACESVLEILHRAEDDDTLDQRTVDVLRTRAYAEVNAWGVPLD